MKRIPHVVLLLALILSLAPATLTSASGAVQQQTYTVQSGDNLYRIALRFGTTVQAIQQANGLSSSIIFPGQTLVIPGGSSATTGTSASATTTTSSGGTYTVRAGDTLFRIALNNGTTVSAIQQANGLTSSIIRVGQVLVIPGSSTTTTSSASTPASSTTTTTTTSGGAYTVKPGDTLFRIALNHGTTVSAVQQANGLTSSLIYVGQVLTIPGAGGSTTSTSTPATSTTTTSPVTSAGTSGAFALGGQVAGFGSSAVTAMQSAGMTWAKRQVVWKPGASASSQTGLITDAHGKGFKILLSVVGGPSYSGSSNYAEFAKYVGALAAAGADGIEVWNEQNIDREWAAGQISASSYTSLLSQAYNAIKTANANTLVITGALAPTGYFGGCTANGCDDAPYVSSMVAAGALNYADCVGIHYNEGLLSPTASSGDPRGNSSHYTRYYQKMVDTYWAAIGGKRKLCFTELGYLSGQEWGALPAGFLWSAPYNMTVQQHADYLSQAASLSKSQGKVKLMIVFNVDFTTFTTDPQAGYAIIRPDGSCPACTKLGAVMGVGS